MTAPRHSIANALRLVRAAHGAARRAALRHGRDPTLAFRLERVARELVRLEATLVQARRLAPRAQGRTQEHYSGCVCAACRKDIQIAALESGF